jgi:hypothetical protein
MVAKKTVLNAQERRLPLHCPDCGAEATYNERAHVLGPPTPYAAKMDAGYGTLPIIEERRAVILMSFASCNACEWCGPIGAAARR